jgi:hypothetical protein
MSRNASVNVSSAEVNVHTQAGRNNTRLRSFPSGISKTGIVIGFDPPAHRRAGTRSESAEANSPPKVVRLQQSLSSGCATGAKEQLLHHSLRDA